MIKKNLLFHFPYPPSNILSLLFIFMLTLTINFTKISNLGASNSKIPIYSVFGFILIGVLYFLASSDLNFNQTNNKSTCPPLLMPLRSPTFRVEESFNKPVVYEINIAAFLYELSLKYNREITFSNFPLAELDFILYTFPSVNVIWFMGIWQKGEYGLNHDKTDAGLLANYKAALPSFTQEDIIGSPYAIKSYTIDTLLGSEADFLKIKNYLASLGVRVMLDFVPNHTAVDHEWAKSNPDFYILQDASSCKAPTCVQIGEHYINTGGDLYNSGWTDTIQLNYFNPDTRLSQIANIKKIASLSDYIRCDMSHDILNDLIEKTWGNKIKQSKPATEFWTDVMLSVGGDFPNIQFVAEAYNYGVTNPPEIQLLKNLGFDFVYEKTILDDLVSINKGNMNPRDITTYLKSQSLSYFNSAVFFVENHDDNRAVTILGSTQNAINGAILTSTLPGMKLYFHGQFQGLANKMDVHLRRSSDTGVPLACLKTQDFFSVLMNVTSNSVFQFGNFEILNVNPDNGLIAYKYTNSETKILIVINYSNNSNSGAVVLSDAVSSTGESDIDVTEVLTNTIYKRNVKDLKTTGLYCIIDKMSSQIFKY